MNDLLYCNRGTKWAIVYLALLVASLLIFWQVGFVGVNPIKIDVTRIVDASGRPTMTLKSGSVIGIHRNICSTQAIGVQFFPSLRDENGQQFTLPPGVYDIQRGCTEKA